MYPIAIDPLSLLTQLAIVLAIGVLMKAVSKKTGFPFIVGLILAGTIAASFGMLNMETWGGFGEIIRTLAIVIIVFSAGFRLQLREMRQDSKTIMMLSTLGVLITFAIITGITYSLLGISLIAAAFLGALLSGSDAAAISESSQGKSRVSTILLSESVFNQPLTLILPLLLLDYVVKPEMALLQVPKFFLLIAIGVAVGLLGAFIGQKILLALRAEHEEVAGLMIAIAVYVIAENLFGSGILAVAITALMLSSRQIPAKEVLGKFSNQLAFIFTVFVFVLLGMQFTLQGFAAVGITRGEIIAIVAALLVARLASSLIVLFKTGLPAKDKIKIGLIAPKGIAPAALAPLLLVYGIAGAGTVTKIVYIAIIASIFISIIAMRFGEKKSVKEMAEERTKEHAMEKLAKGKSQKSKPLLE